MEIGNAGFYVKKYNGKTESTIRPILYSSRQIIEDILYVRDNITIIATRNQYLRDQRVARTNIVHLKSQNNGYSRSLREWIVFAE